jgi:two-component system, cell cycle response regulator DivK
VSTVFHDDTRKTRRILVVEPDDETRALYSELLHRAGCEVVEASDGREALVKAFAQTPTLVMTATRLPMLDGYALCEVLRADPMTRTVPILAMTTEARPADVERGRTAGADAILVKPATLDAVLNEVRRLLAAPTESRRTTATAAEHDRQRTSIATRSTGDRHAALARAHRRFETTTPPISPPDLLCPSCDGPLMYEKSYIGGVSAQHGEQWDYYTCANACGTFQYRQRTRRVRRSINLEVADGLFCRDRARRLRR